MLKDKKSKTLQIRIDEENYEKLQAISFMLGTTPSGLARQLIQMSINSYNNVFVPAAEVLKEKNEELKGQLKENYED